jgi:lipopolysaccharide biosynthesis protein
MKAKDVKFIAYYYPQFHAIKENDVWWGENFTDWIYVKNAKPLFEKHYQPRIPLNDNYYNLSESGPIKWQVDLANQYGVSGFCFHHYWFDGKLLLEKPLEIFLQNKDFNISFCISWANESWTRRWIGKNNVVLQEQKHTADPKLWETHFNYLLPFLKDPRYIKIDNKPVFIIYQPNILKKSTEMFALWCKLAKDNGLNGIYFIATKNHEILSKSYLENYSGLIKFQPREANNSKAHRNKVFFSRFQFLRYLPIPIINLLTDIKHRITDYEVISIDDIWDAIYKNVSDDSLGSHLNVFEGAFIEWDNTPRYNNKSKIFYDTTPQRFEEHVRKLISLLPEKKTFIFINAWNEWSESAYLEPDEKNGYSYLQALKNIVDSINK